MPILSFLSHLKKMRSLLWCSEKLQPKYPEDLPDDNHKPEIGLALTDFDCFAAFRPFESIQASIQAIPELHQALGSTADAMLKGEASEELLRKGVSVVCA